MTVKICLCQRVTADFSARKRCHIQYNNTKRCGHPCRLVLSCPQPRIQSYAFIATEVTHRIYCIERKKMKWSHDCISNGIVIRLVKKKLSSPDTEILENV